MKQKTLGINYSSILTDEEKTKFKSYIEIKDGYEKFMIVAGILFLIVIIMVVKTNSIQTSTKVSILLVILAVGLYLLKFTVTGNIIYTLDVILQCFGIILILVSYYYIYKHDNLLIYIPICALGIYYSVKYVGIFSNNITGQIILIAAPIALYILGTAMRKVKEIELLIPVKEKHERKKDENK